MNTNLEQVRELVSEAIGGKAYLAYPQKKIQTELPFAVVSISASSYLQDKDGKDIMTLLTYTVRIFAEGQRDLLGLADAVAESLSRYRIRLLGSTPMYSDPTYGPMVLLTFDTILDRRSNSFITG